MAHIQNTTSNVSREVSPIDVNVFFEAIEGLYRENPLTPGFAHHFYDLINEGEEKIIELIKSKPATGDAEEMAIRQRAAKLKRIILQAENVSIDYRLAGERNGSYLLMRRPGDAITVFSDL